MKKRIVCLIICIISLLCVVGCINNQEEDVKLDDEITNEEEKNIMIFLIIWSKIKKI